jgi:hypothetical protein
MSPIGSVSCADVSIDGPKQALRDVASYAYEGEGYVEAYEEFTGDHDVLDMPEKTIRRPTKFSGAYVAPDGQTEERHLVTRDDFVEARRTIGDDVWFRFLGSRRWQQMEVTPAPANPILAIVDQRLRWAIADLDVMPGHCLHVGTSADGPWTVKVTVPVGSHMPTSVELTQRFDNPPDWGQAILQTDVYRIQADAQVTIDPPPTDTSPATAADALYALERRSCLDAPCDISDLRLAYEVHNGEVDLFGYDRPGANGYVWFEDGLVATMGSSACAAREWDVTFHTKGEPGDAQWIGGPLEVAEPATMHVRWRDGEQSEHTVSSPGYIVPAGVVGGPEIESIRVVAASGDELFHYDYPSPETGVPPPPPPDC